MRNGCNRGFSLVEAVIATVLAVVGLTAVMSAYGAINASRLQTRESERMLRLALEKYEEVVATGAYEQAPLSGAIDGTDYTYSVESYAGITADLREVVVVLRSTKRRDDAGLEVRGMVFVPQAVGTGGTQQ